MATMMRQRPLRTGGSLYRLANGSCVARQPISIWSTSSRPSPSLVPSSTPDTPVEPRDDESSLYREPPRNIAVLGGGLTGLATTYILARELPLSSTITLYETSDRLGGWVQTIDAPIRGSKNQMTVRFERGPRMIKSLGKDVTRFDDLPLMDIIKDGQLSIAGYRGLFPYLFSDRHGLTPLKGFQNMGKLITANPFQFVCRLLLARLFTFFPAALGGPGPPSGNDISLADHMLWEVGGSDIADNVASAMVHGIFGGDIDRISSREFIGGRFLRLFYKKELGRLARTATKDHQAVFPWECELLERLANEETVSNPAINTAFLDNWAPCGGMQALPDWITSALAMQDNIKVRKNTAVSQLGYDGDNAQVLVTSRPEPQDEPATEAYDAVVSTLPSQRLAAIAPPGSLPSLADSPSVDIMAVNLWYRRTGLIPKNGIGYLIPRSVSREENPHRALGVMFDSNATQRPEGEREGTKLFVLLGGHYYKSELSPPKDEAEAIMQARETVHMHLGIPLDLEPDAAVAGLAKECIPQHEVGHADRMAKAHAEVLAAFAGKLSVAGPSYRGMGVLGAVRAGWEAGMRLAGKAKMTHLGDTGLAMWGDMKKEKHGLYFPVPVPKAWVQKVRRIPQRIFVVR